LGLHPLPPFFVCVSFAISYMMGMGLRGIFIVFGAI
jgi:hypothetical protein